MSVPLSSLFAVGDLVCDRWWPWQQGPVLWVGVNRVKVRLDDSVAYYDRAHAVRFLRVIR